MDSKPNNKNNVQKKDIDINVKDNPENIDLNIEDIEIEDLSFDLNITPNSSSEMNLNTTGSVDGSKGNSLEANESVGTDSNLTNSGEQGISNNVQLNDSAVGSPAEDFDTGSSNVNDSDTDATDLFDNQDNYDDRSLREKVQDLKDDFKQAKENLENAKEKIQNLPEDIKNKKEDIQKKAKKAKENIKNLPENAKKKAEDVKDRARQAKENLQNFPKSKEELGSAVKDRLKKSAQRAKEKAQDTANKALEKGKENLKDRIENSKPVKAAKKAKRAYNNTKKAIDRTKKAAKATKKAAKVAVKTTKAAAKAAVKVTKGLIDLIVATFPWSLIVIAVVLLVALVIIIAVAVVPGKDDIKDSYESENYSEKDLKTLGKLRDLYQKYPNADAALAMVTVIYPYYETLQDGNVTYYLNTSNEDWDPSKTYKDYEDITDYEDKDESEDEESCEDDDCDAEVGDDMYLELFRKWSYRRKFKKLLKKSNSMNEDEFTEYLKKEYFTSESGYKTLFGYVDEDRQDEFADAIIEDLKSKKSYFMNYIYDVVVCTNSSITLGYSYAGDIIQGEPVVVLKDSSSGNFSTIKAAPSLYGTDDLSLDLKRYVMGVAYAEVGGGVKREAEAKAVMITAKSFVLGRTGPGSSDVGMGFKIEQRDGKTIFYMRASTADQDFCDIYEGCKSGSRYAKELQQHPFNKETLNNTKSKLDDESIANLEKWYDETAGEFVYDSEHKAFAGNQYNDYNSYCKVGACLSQTKAADLAKQGKDYKTILYGSQGAFTEARFEKFDMETKSLSKESPTCDGLSSQGACGIPDDQYKYYKQTDYKDTFCGRKDGATISSSGCGVTSMAMVIANLTNETNITPVDTMNEADAGGYCGAGINGTAAGYFKVAAEKHGLTYKSLTVDKKGAEGAISILKSGGLVIANVGKASPFTEGGHYIVIRKVDGEGNVYVGDPNHDELFNTPYNINKFINENWITHGWWGFTSSKSADIVKNYCVSETVEGKGETTGTLTNPLYPNDNSTKKWYSSLGSNSKTLNYLSGSYHGGSDLPIATGHSVYAMDGGTVKKIQDHCGSYGRHIVLEHETSKGKYYTIYAHLSSIESNVKKIGTKISKGQLLGKSGTTYHCGSSVAAHLHVGISYDSNGSFPQSSGDKSFLIGNFMGTGKSYTIVNGFNLNYYKAKHY